jgi:AraC-like DNA-binding protein
MGLAGFRLKGTRHLCKAGQLSRGDGEWSPYPLSGAKHRRPRSRMSVGELRRRPRVLSVAIAPELLPEAQIEATMGFLRAGALPDLPRVAGRLTTAESALEAEVLSTELVTLVLESKVLRSDGADLSPGRRSVVEAQEFLRVSLGARPGLDDLAKAVGVNKFTLLKRFREAVGTTPYAYLRLLRLATARDRLAAGGAPAEVAFETGFSDQSHLGRDFRRAYGVTPAAYARQARSTHLISGTRDNGVQDKRRVISPGAELS